MRNTCSAKYHESRKLPRLISQRLVQYDSLADCAKQHAPTPSDSGDEEQVKGIVFNDQIRLARNKFPQAVVKAQLTKVGIITGEALGDHSNSSGLSLLEERGEWRTRFERIEAQLNHHSTKFPAQGHEIGTLKPRAHHLSIRAIGYNTIRSRFLDTYKRDFKDRDDLRGSKTIRDGDRAAHHGDSVADAYLFQEGKRNDYSIYRELYGLEPNQTIKYCDSMLPSD